MRTFNYLLEHCLSSAYAGFACPVEGIDYEMIERTPEMPVNADFCIDVIGTSMEPYIKDGQRVYVQRNVDVQEFEDACIWYYKGNVYCKQFCIDSDGGLLLFGSNSQRKDYNIRIPREERVNAVCYGRVILPYKLPRPEYINQK